MKQLHEGSLPPSTRRTPRHWVDELLSGEPEMYEGGPASLHRPASCTDPMRLANPRPWPELQVVREALRELRARSR